MTTKITTNDFDFSGVVNIIATPIINNISYVGDDTALDPAGGISVTVNGYNFNNPSLYLDNTLVTLTSSTSTQMVFVAPAKSAGSYSLRVVNENGAVGYYLKGFHYSGTPTWSTTAGSLGSFYELNAVSIQLSASSDSAVTYSLYSGTLPAGITLSSSGLISGTLGTFSSSTVYNFQVSVKDAENQNTERSFSLTALPDSVSWTSAPPATKVWPPNVAMTAFSFTATSAAGLSITYSVDTLPTGLSLSGNSISGTPTTTQNVNTTVTATSASGKTVTQVIAFSIMNVIGQAAYTTPGTYSWTAPAGVTSVCVVAVGGGGGGAQWSSYARGGGGGGTLWVNNWPVVPGQSYTVVVGSGGAPGAYASTSRGTTGGTSYFIDSVNVLGANGGGGGGIGSATVDNGGTGGGGNYGGDPAGGGGGAGGWGGWGYAYAGAGGGAGGYTGQGGAGYTTSFTTYYGGGNAGAGGGGGAGSAGGTTKTGGGGGGTGIYGSGTAGAATATTTASNNGRGGNGGSYLNGTGVGGANGGATPANTATGAAQNTTTPNQPANGGFPGGGGGGTDYTTSPYRGGTGGNGAVRIIWGYGRAFPSTLTTDQ